MEMRRAASEPTSPAQRAAYRARSNAAEGTAQLLDGGRPSGAGRGRAPRPAAPHTPPVALRTGRAVLARRVCRLNQQDTPIKSQNVAQVSENKPAAIFHMNSDPRTSVRIAPYVVSILAYDSERSCHFQGLIQIIKSDSWSYCSLSNAKLSV